MMNTQDQWLERIASYLSGNSSPAERDALERWLDERPEQRAFFNEVKKLWETDIRDEDFQADVPAAWQRLDRRLDELPGSGSAGGQKRNLPRKIRYSLWAAAAAVVLLLGISLWLWTPEPQRAEPKIVRTGPGEKTEHRLPDGSVVWLNAASRISYPAEFGQRSVRLSGEAYFEVVRDEERPFTVQAPNSRITVLGTSFNVRAYPRENEERVSVNSGRVSVRAAEDTLLLTAGKASVYQRTTQTLRRQSQGLGNALSWHTGQFQFDGIPLEKAIPELERFYNAPIELENELLGRCPLNGNYKDQELETILTTFALATGAKVQREGDTWVISGEGCR